MYAYLSVRSFGSLSMNALTAEPLFSSRFDEILLTNKQVHKLIKNQQALPVLYDRGGWTSSRVTVKLPCQQKYPHTTSIYFMKSL